MGRRVDVKPYHVCEFLDEPWVLLQRDDSHPMRRQAVGLPEPLDADHPDPDDIGHHPGGPVRRFTRRIAKCQAELVHANVEGPPVRQDERPN